MQSALKIVNQYEYPIHEAHHKEWFIQGLFPLMKIPLSQQVITSPKVALEQAMKIEPMVSYIGLMGMGIGTSSSSRESSQVHYKLVEITERPQNMNTPKEQ